MVVIGSGAGLPFPATPITLPVVVQVQTSDAACWTTDLP